MKLYHLTSAEYAISNIALRRLKIARFGDLNDPFELLAAGLKDKAFRKAVRSWKKEFHNTKGLLCFSADWKNPVLWSHYADKHRGICLGFEVDDKYLTPVNYAKERIQIRFKNSDPEQGLELDFVNEMLRTKYKHWVYEQETRIFLDLNEGTKENGLFFCSFSDELQLNEVILGPYCETPIEEIKNMVEKTNGPTKITKSRLGFTRFEVVPDQRYENK